MGVIATLLAHEPRLARLRTAARDRYRFVPCEDWTSLTRACERGPVNVVVFDLYVDGRADFERVRQLRVRHRALSYDLTVDACDPGVPLTARFCAEEE